MTLFSALLIATALLCSLVTGFLFGFALIVMPGIKKLTDGEYIRAFQEMDRIIQNNHPLFILLWLGSVLAFIAVMVMGWMSLEGMNFQLLAVSAAFYFLGLQLPTIAKNVPLNNALQKHETLSMSTDELGTARQDFEGAWNRWNTIRTIFGIISCLLLYTLLLII